jgi:acyl phosphate:glycerol-3-phosphate acyltransferase
MIRWIACMAVAYFAGSIPFGVIIGRLKGIDIRAHGSMNIGATNVGRVLGRKFGILCFALDFLKGAVPVIVAGSVMGVLGRDAHQLSASEMWWWLGVMLMAVLGHMFSFFLGFRGGKGVATGFGALMGMYPLLTFAACGAIVVWYVALRLFKFVSLASILAVLSLPLGYLLSVTPRQAMDQPLSTTLAQLGHASPPLVVTAALAALVVWKHRGNIARLRRGEELRVDGPARRGGTVKD